MNCLIINLIITITIALLLVVSYVPYLRSKGYSNNRAYGLAGSIFFITSFIQLSFIRTFVDIGSVPDLDIYQESFDYLKHSPLSSLFISTGEKTNELGFRFLMWIVGKIGGGFRLFLFIVVSIYLLCYYYAIKKYSPSIILSIIFLLLTSYNQSIYILRQHLSIAVLLLSYEFIINRKLFKFLIVCMLATLFHTTALIWIPVYFVYGIRNNIVLVTLVVTIGALLSVFWQQILLYVGTDLLIGYASYLDSDIVSNNVGAIVSFSYLLLYLVIMRKQAFSEGIYRLLLISSSIALVLTIIGIGFNPTSRLALNFNSCLFLLIPIIIKKSKLYLVKGSIFIVIAVLQYYISFVGTKFSVLEDIRLIF